MEKTKIWLSSPHMGGKERDFVNTAFDTNWVAPLGPNVDGFENDLAKFTGVPHVAALSSGTAALHLALVLAGVGPEDEVICQSFTFSASANPIVYQGARPIFIDSESNTWNMDPILLEEAIMNRMKHHRKPKAIIVVHLYGMPADMEKISEIAARYDIALIEDAAEALGSTYEGKACGSFGQFGILSFNGNKIITTSGGGALVSTSEEMVKKARFLATQARDAAPHYQHSHIGYNYRMSNICAGIGRGQMLVLNERVAQRRQVYEFYKSALKGIEAIQFLEEQANSFCNRWLTCILVDPKNGSKVNRETIRLALEVENIEARPLWKPMHLQPIFSNYPYFGKGVSDELFENGLCLPSGSNLTESDLQRVVDVILNLFKK